MQIIKRTTLLYQAGSSAKVYEIDLCQVGDNRYVVNSRYGKQGAVLKENSETVTAVSLEQAQKLCDRLVNAKVNKGYRDATGETEATSTPIAIPPPIASPLPIEIPVDSDARSQAILNRLVAILNVGVPSSVASRSGVRNTRRGRQPHTNLVDRMGNPLVARRDRQHPLDRLTWRVGELKIAAAAPLLLRMLNTSRNPIRNYAIAWSLGWCGDRSVIPPLEGLYQNSATPDSVRRIAFEAVFKLADSAKQAEMRSQLIAQLPIALQAPVRHGTAEQFAEAFQTLLNSDDRYRFMAIELLYQIDSEKIRPVILEVLRTVPLEYNYFQRVRHIFKIAEYRQDGEAFAILAKRFDQDKKAECEEMENNQVYSQKTRSYLRRRVWRSLRKLGELNDPAYINLAVSILLQYSDIDAEEVRQSVYYTYDRNWRRYESARIEWDIYAKYLTFNHILYEHSPRYVLKPNARAWRCVPPYKPESPEPKVREEAFPQLWEQHPTALLQLLLESKARPVHHFAVKALRSCQSFCAELTLENLIKILARPYEVTAQLGFELARERYQPEQPDGKLILAVANCTFAPARTEAYRWINEQRDRFLNEDSQLIAGLVLSKQAETRNFARQLLGAAILSDVTVRSLIGQIIALMLTLQPDQAEQAKQGAETLLLSFSLQLRSLGLEIILDLLRHPLPELQTLGAQILVNHEINVMDLPSGLMEALLESPYDHVRVLGVRLFGQLPDRVLLERTTLILAIATHAIADMREAIRPIIRRLANENHDFSLTLAGQLLQILLAPEANEGVHKFLSQLLQNDLPEWMSAATQELTQQLLQTKSTAAQEVAGSILSVNGSVWASSFTTAEIAQFGNHEVLTVRRAAYAMGEQILPRLHRQPEELLAALPFLESHWDDARLFGFRLFGELLQPEDFTPVVIISICDSIRADVRKFGRDLVSRCFQETDGQEYLVKFSEHPSTDMQLFATNYLENYAANNPSRLQELIPYFTRVLAQVNRGRVTKQRVFAFLNQEAIKSEAAAHIVAQIFTRQSAAIAIGDKAKALESLLKIHLTYPQIPLPIKLLATPTKS